MSVVIKGADNYISMVNDLASKVPQQARDAVKKYTTATQSQAVRLEPVKTGYLRRSTSISFINTTQQSTGTVTANAYNRGYNYGARQEFDSKLKHPNGGQAHFMETAFNAQKAGFIRDVKGIF